MRRRRRRQQRQRQRRETVIGGLILVIGLAGCDGSSGKGTTASGGAGGGAPAASGGSSGGQGGRGGGPNLSGASGGAASVGSGGVAGSVGGGGAGDRAGTSAGGAPAAGGAPGAGGTSGLAGAGGAAGDGGAPAFTDPGGDFIYGVVDGTPLLADQDVTARPFLGQLNQFQVSAGTGAWQWDMVVQYTSASDSNVCIQILLQTEHVIPNVGYASLATGGSCNVQITRAAPSVGDILEGTFSAVLPQLGGSVTKVATQGRFRAHLAQ